MVFRNSNCANLGIDYIANCYHGLAIIFIFYGGKNMWMVFAILSAIFAALTSILAKIGINEVPSNLATGIRQL